MVQIKIYFKERKTMKKLLATLLVAVMIMSCLSVVSFAADGDSIYTVEQIELSPVYKTTRPYRFMDDFTNDYYSSLVKYSESDESIWESAILCALDDLNTAKGGADATAAFNALENKYTSTDFIAVPIYTGIDEVCFVNVNIEYDPAYVTPVKGIGLAPDYQNDEEEGVFLTNYAVGEPLAAGYIGSLYFAVNAATDNNKGNEAGEKEITFDIAVGTGTNAPADKDGAPVSASVGNEIAKATITGLLEGEAAEAPKMEAEDVEAIETSKIVYAGEDTFANFKNAYGLGVDVAADYTEEMSYVCAFGTVDTTKEADEYGFKLTTSYGKVIKGKAVNVSAEGKFGIVFYGADYVLEGATIEAYAIVDGAEI